MSRDRQGAAVSQRSAARWALSRLSIALSAPLWFFAPVFNEPAAYDSWRSVMVIGAISAVGLLVLTVLMMLAARLPVIRTAHGWREVALVGAMVVIASEARVAVLVSGLDAAGLRDDVGAINRIVGAAVSALILYALLGRALHAWARYRGEREELLASLLEGEREAEVHEAALTAMTRIVRLDLSDQLARSRAESDRALDALADSLRSGGDGREELSRLHSVTDQHWRRIASDLFSRFSAPLARPRIRELLWAYVPERPFPPFAIVLGALVMLLFVFGRVLDAESTIAALTLWLATALVVAVGANTLVTRVPRYALAIVVASFVLLLTFPALVVVVGIIDPDDVITITRTAWMNFYVVVVVALTATPSEIVRNRDAVVASLRREFDEANLRRLQLETRMVRVSRDLAARLHGPARSALLAAALQLGDALNQGKRELALARVEDLRAAIRGVELSSAESLLAVDISSLGDVIANWRSVCDIEVTGSWSDLAPSLLADAHSVLIEGISDAVRHAKCTRVQITVQTEPGGVVLVIANDGVPIPEIAEPGLGSRLLDYRVHGQWSRGTDARGWTVTRVVLAADGVELRAGK
jgi:signal transduction histidine kinase